MEKPNWTPDIKTSVDNVLDNVSELNKRGANERLNTALAFRKLLADFFGAVKLENLQAIVAPPVNWTDNWSIAARVAKSTNITTQPPVNVSNQQSQKPWKTKTLPWKEI